MLIFYLSSQSSVNFDLSRQQSDANEDPDIEVQLPESLSVVSHLKKTIKSHKRTCRLGFFLKTNPLRVKQSVL